MSSSNFHHPSRSLALTGGPGETLRTSMLVEPGTEALPSALAALDRGGCLAIAGIHLSGVPALDYEAHLFQERSLCSVTANTRALEETKHAAPATALSLIFAALPCQRERSLRKRSSDSPTKTRSGNATARALKVPSSGDQAVECAGEGRERGARRRWQEGEGVSLNRPSPAAHEGADQGAGASETPTQLAAESHPASRNGTLWTGARLNPHEKMPRSPVKTIARWPRPKTGRSGGLAQGSRRRRIVFPVPAVRYQRTRGKLACT